MSATKLKRMCPVFMVGAALAFLALGPGLASAAPPATLGFMLAPDTSGSAMNGKRHETLRSGNSGAGYRLRASDPINFHSSIIDKRVSAGEWTPRVLRWSSYHAGLFGMDFRRLRYAGAVPVTIVDQRFLIFSRSDMRRKRIDLIVTTGF
jgi:hypothetical protein